MFLTSCAVQHPRAAHESHPNEIADNPAILYDGTVPREQLTLHAIKLGDSETAIAESHIENHGTAGWIVCDNRARYRIENGKIVTLGVWDPRILNKLNIHSPADIETHFGKPQSIDTANPLLIYNYDSGHITVLWDTTEEHVDAINIK